MAFYLKRRADHLFNRPKNSGDRIRTCDLRVMSPTSCQTALPRDLYLQIFASGKHFVKLEDTIILFR